MNLIFFNPAAILSHRLGVAVKILAKKLNNVELHNSILKTLKRIFYIHLKGAGWSGSTKSFKIC